MEKGIFPGLDNEMDIVDNSSSSSSSNLKVCCCEFSLTGESLLQDFFFSDSEDLRKVGRIFQNPTQRNDRDYVDGSGSRLRPVLPGIAGSQRKERQISDPVQQILIQLHKIIFNTQLLQGSPELIEPNSFTADCHGVHISSGGNMLLLDDRKGILGTSGVAEGMTYEQLQVSLLSKGSKELPSKRGECVILNKGFGIIPKEVSLPVLQQRLITKGSGFAR